MKTLSLVILMALSISSSAFAGREGGGGDASCEDRFKIVRDDLKKWISNGGSAGLNLPENVTLNQYNTSMLDNIGRAQVSCTDDAVKIGKADKTCKFFWDDSGVPQILCNRTLFVKETKEDAQYVQVHHEYAGLAGLEVPDGEDSKYPISNQITASLENQVIRHLVVRSPGAKAISTAECISQVEILVKGVKDHGFLVRGPSLSMGGKHANSVAWPNAEKRHQFAYSVTALEDGQLEIWLDILKGKQLLTLQGSGFTAGNVYTQTIYNNASATGGGALEGLSCQIGLVIVRCAETKEEANKLWIDPSTGKSYEPDLKKIPSNCRP